MRIYKKVLSIIFLLLFALQASGELTITVTPPVFTEEELNNAEILGGYLEQFRTEVASYFDNFIGKPQLLASFCGANGFSGLGFTGGGEYSYFTLGIGGGAGIQLPGLDPELLEEELGNFSLGNDYTLGGGFQPLSLIVSLKAGVLGLPFSGLESTFHAGIFRFDYPLYGNTPADTQLLNLFNFNLGIALAYPLLQEKALTQWLKWEPLRLHAGISYFYNRLSLEMEAGLQSVPVTLQGTYNGFPVNVDGAIIIDADPVMGLQSETWGIPLLASTTIEAGWLLRLQFLAGLELFFGKSALFIEETQPLEIIGDLGPYVEEAGGIEISGDLEENAPFPVRLIGALVLGIEAEPLWIRIPVVYYLNYGVSVGIYMGVNI